MLVQGLLLLVIFLLVILAVIMMMLRHNRHSNGYPPGGYYNDRDSPGGYFLFIGLLFIVATGVIYSFNADFPTNITELPLIRKGKIDPSSTVPAPEDEYPSVIKSLEKNQGRLNEKELAPIGESTTSPNEVQLVITPTPPGVQPDSYMNTVDAYGYRHASSNNLDNAIEAVEKLKSTYPEAHYVAINDQTGYPYKIVIFSAVTKQEVLDWGQNHVGFSESQVIKLPGT